MKSPIADEQRLEHIWHCLARIQEVVKDINALAAQFEPICTALPKADSLPEGIDLL